MASTRPKNFLVVTKLVSTQYFCLSILGLVFLGLWIVTGATTLIANPKDVADEMGRLLGLDAAALLSLFMTSFKVTPPHPLVGILLVVGVVIALSVWIVISRFTLNPEVSKSIVLDIARLFAWVFFIILIAVKAR